MKSFPFTRSRPRVASATKRFFRAISYRVARFRSHRSSLHSDRCSRMWTLRCRENKDSLAFNPADSDLNSPLITHQRFLTSRSLPCVTQAPFIRKSLALYMSLDSQSLAVPGFSISHHANWCTDNILSARVNTFSWVKADLNVRNASPDEAHVLGNV